MKKYPLIDLFAGITGFSLEAERTGRFETIMTSEIDPYCVKLIDQKYGYENAGNVEAFAVPSAHHPDQELIDEDKVPCEETGFSSLCLEDFHEGVLEYPFCITGGFPCVDITSANSNAQGIAGEFSGLVHEQLRIIKDLNPKFAIFENSDRLTGRGLDYILNELSSEGYLVEWETITAAAFGFPHYRHRCYIVAYRQDTVAAMSRTRIMDHVRDSVPETPEWKMPLNIKENAKAVLDRAVAEIPRDIKLRTKRINGLGNSIIPDIARAIFQAIIAIEDGDYRNLAHPNPIHAKLFGEKWLFNNGKELKTLPASGFMSHGVCYTPDEPCRKLNPTRSQYPNLFSTLIKKDGNNNFTCKSRLSRPGKLGGLIGDLMHLGADTGGLHPEFGELFMGYEVGHTELPQTRH